MGHTISGVGVLDKADLVLRAVEGGACSLGELCERTGLSRATAHRLATALDTLGLLGRLPDGRFTLGVRLIALGSAATRTSPLVAHSTTVLAALRDETGESVQLYVRDGHRRVCVASLPSPHELRTMVSVGQELSLERGSAGRVLRGDDIGSGGWIATVADREAGVCSVSAPVIAHGEVVAAVGVSGPLERVGSDPGRRFGSAVVGCATTIGSALDVTLDHPDRRRVSD